MDNVMSWNCNELMGFYRTLKNDVNDLNNLLESMLKAPESIGEDDFDVICDHLNTFNSVVNEMKEFVKKNYMV